MPKPYLLITKCHPLHHLLFIKSIFVIEQPLTLSKEFSWILGYLTDFQESK